jgi:hypothetical protein
VCLRYVAEAAPRHQPPLEGRSLVVDEHSPAAVPAIALDDNCLEPAGR